jgi:integrase/recombinase XerD
MKRLPINSPAFTYIEKSFKEWLDVLGYAEQTVYSMPIYVRGLLHYIESQGKTHIRDISPKFIKAYYYMELKQRPNLMRKAGGLSNNHLNKHIQAILKFRDYLRQSGRLLLPSLDIKFEQIEEEEVEALREEEIKSLYTACDAHPDTSTCKPSFLYPALALRDKAMLTIYYGCGLRRSEGLQIELNDILWDKQLLYVRKGKNNKERFVPLNKAGLKHLENYQYNSRPLFLKNEKEERFFISERGKPISGQMLLLRLNQLITRTENTVLQNKRVGLHTLRHSIATHLLSNGMQMEHIKEFLGHSSLESTQIYTHLVEKENAPEDAPE